MNSRTLCLRVLVGAAACPFVDCGARTGLDVPVDAAAVDASADVKSEAAIDANMGDAAVGPFLYWANFEANSIGRANIDGTGANGSFIAATTLPYGVVTDSNFIYWSGDLTTISRANRDGTDINPAFIVAPGAPEINALAIDGAHIYWAESRTIGRANLDGSGVQENFIDTGYDFLIGIAVDSAHIYWTQEAFNTIGRANLDGTNAGEFIALPDPAPGPPLGPAFLALDSSHLYWTNAWHDTIGRANLDGSGVSPSFITADDPIGDGTGGPLGIAVDDSHIYWTNDQNGTIGRANLDGTDVNESFIVAPQPQGQPGPYGITVDLPPK